MLIMYVQQYDIQLAQLGLRYANRSYLFISSSLYVQEYLDQCVVNFSKQVNEEISYPTYSSC